MLTQVLKNEVLTALKFSGTFISTRNKKYVKFATSPSLKGDLNKDANNVQETLVANQNSNGSFRCNKLFLYL